MRPATSFSRPPLAVYWVLLWALLGLRYVDLLLARATPTTVRNLVMLGLAPYWRLLASTTLAAGLVWWIFAKGKKRIAAAVTAVSILGLWLQHMLAPIKLNLLGLALTLRPFLESSTLLLAGATLIYELRARRENTSTLGRVSWIAGFAIAGSLIAIHIAGTFLDLSSYGWTLASRAILSLGLLLAAIGIGLGLRTQSHWNARWLGLCVGVPLLSRIALSGWVGLLGVPLSEDRTGIHLLIWIASMTALAVFRWPAIPRFAQVIHGAGSLSICLLLFLHYTYRFGSLELQFDAISRSLLGVYFPYPTLAPSWGGPVFAVGLHFALFVTLGAIWSRRNRELGLSLALLLLAGVGLDRTGTGLALAAAWLAVDRIARFEESNGENESPKSSTTIDADDLWARFQKHCEESWNGEATRVQERSTLVFAYALPGIGLGQNVRLRIRPRSCVVDVHPRAALHEKPYAKLIVPRPNAKADNFDKSTPALEDFKLRGSHASLEALSDANLRQLRDCGPLKIEFYSTGWILQSSGRITPERLGALLQLIDQLRTDEAMGTQQVLPNEGSIS